MASMRLEVVFEDHTPHKWRVPLKEDVFGAFMAKGGPVMHKFFDPSDAFPLWEFEPGVLLSDLQNPCVDWFQTEACYVLKTELPDIEKSSIRVYVENGKVMEISGLWNHKGESRASPDWQSGKWWERGFVRRLELPENVDWKKTEAHVNNDTILDIRLPKLQQNVT
ncbi:putative small heat shock protein HSP20 [Helianthus annuus]|uniref:Small heat shock protein HSP20 n=1 Tax=Helianthus annuus TaxID=4232 RepID=A0A9K3MZ64_HELAN|nr:putative small heat shock protein HSP20 [Helianthus annuus]